MENFYYAASEQGLSREEIRAALLQSLEGRTLRHALIIPPDFTRFHSNAGYITNVYYHALVEMGAEVERGEYPCDMETLGEMVQDICWRNAVKYFGFSL